MSERIIKRASYSLEDEYIVLFKEIAWRDRRSMTEELRALIDARARTLGLQPIRPVDPNSLPPALEMAPNRM